MVVAVMIHGQARERKQARHHPNCEGIGPPWTAVSAIWRHSVAGVEHVSGVCQGQVGSLAKAGPASIGVLNTAQWAWPWINSDTEIANLGPSLP